MDDQYEELGEDQENAEVIGKALKWSGVIEAAVSADPSLVPTARNVLTLAVAEVEAERFLTPEAALPVYLREADAWRKS